MLYQEGTLYYKPTNPIPWGVKSWPINCEYFTWCVPMGFPPLLTFPSNWITNFNTNFNWLKITNFNGIPTPLKFNMVHLNIRAQVGESRRIQGHLKETSRQATSTRSPRQVFSHGGSAALKTRRWGWFFVGKKNITSHTGAKKDFWGGDFRWWSSGAITKEICGKWPSSCLFWKYCKL